MPISQRSSCPNAEALRALVIGNVGGFGHHRRDTKETRAREDMKFWSLAVRTGK